MLISNWIYVSEPFLIPTTLGKIRGFARLKKGWHYGEGGPIRAQVRTHAESVFQKYLFLGLTRTNAFAGSDGEILVTAYRGDHYYGIIVERSGEVSVRHEEKEQELQYAEFDRIQDALRFLTKIVGETWNTLGSSTHGTMTTNAADSTTYRLRKRGEGSPFSSGLAWRMMAA